ncbi:MAG: Mu-like prophage major head subunit gpT family protein [Polyangiaceae bacterium]|nr:Mu-like prophage major head subunit gpT family protein [Polyangiaceae bacterium]
MPLNPLFGFDTLPKTSAAAIREFSDRYLAAIGAAKPTGWADTLGETIPTDAPMVTFPISQLRTQYKRTEGDSRTKKLGEVSFDIKSEEFDDGYEAKLLDLFLKVFAYRNWQRAPERLVLAEEQFRHFQVAELLSAGTAIPCADKQPFFSQTHPANMTDATVDKTWSNYQPIAKNILGSSAVGNVGTFLTDNLQAEVTAMKTGVLDENGNLFGVDPDTILVPSDYDEAVTIGLANSRILNFVTNDNGIAAAEVDNVYKGKFKVEPVKEFSIAPGTTADWYLVDSKLIRAGLSPWAILKQTVPQSLALRIFDESSDYFKDTGNLKMSSHIWYGFGLALPHAIRRIKGPTRP